MSSIWDREPAADRLRALYAEGRTFSQIAKTLNDELGQSVSRAGVSGKLRRLGIKKQTPSLPGPPAKSMPSKAERDKVVKDVESAGRKVPPFNPARTVDAAIAIAPRPWTTRKSFECAFPLDGPDGEVWSCCNPTDATYCQSHHRVMFRTTEAGWEREAVRSLQRAAA